jgi:diguanylate cyclase (GGDEF)-like protein
VSASDVTENIKGNAHGNAHQQDALDAVEARQAGDFRRAAGLFARAAGVAGELQERLNLQIRQACCLVAAEEFDAAAALARVVAVEARDADHLAELADALGLLVDDHTRAERWAEATQALSEAVYILQRLPNDPAHFQVLHNMAVTYARCGFVEPALELYDRALRLADNDIDRQFAYASMSAAYHDAALRETDPLEQHRLLHDGLYAASAALDPEGAREAMAVAEALAHRAMMLAEIGHYHSAIDDAQRARALAGEHGMRLELALAIAGEALALWGMRRDASVRAVIEEAFEAAEGLELARYLGPLHELEVEVLWTLGLHTEARASLELQLRAMQRRLHDECAVRWEHVRLGAEHLEVAAISETDPLTGLPNRRHLAHVLPEVLSSASPVCVGVVDLDGFKQVNDEYGYLLGDGVLQEVATVLERVLRRGDTVVRLGGDEFVMVLRETSPNDARAVFERVRQLIAMRTWHGIPSEVRLTASVGLVCGNAGHDPDELLGEATAALQQAKKSGRDRIVLR